MKEIIIDIDAHGNEKIELVGFHGQGCDKVLADIADGDTPRLEQSKQEYFESASEGEALRR